VNLYDILGITGRWVHHNFSALWMDNGDKSGLLPQAELISPVNVGSSDMEKENAR